LLLNLNFAFANSIEEEYNANRMSYLRAVLNNNTALEIKHLENIIKYGKKLGHNTSKYEKELAKIKKRKNATSSKTTTKTKVQKAQTAKKVTKNKPKPKTNSLNYTVKNVYTKNNMIVIDFYTNITKKHIDYSIDKTKYSNLYLFDIKGSFKDARPTKLEISGIDRIYIIQKEKNLLHIKVRDKSKLNPIYIVNKKQIIIKFLNISSNVNSNTTKTNTNRNIINVNRYKRKVVVIDAGHGGKDVGAVGSNKKYEKKVVLAVGKYLYNILKKRGYDVYITRKGDTFIEVRNRTILANKKNADIFLSIHANSIAKSKAHKVKGVETFFLSPARSARAKRVAAKENSSDVRSMSNSTKNSFLTVLNQSKITASNKLAIDVQQNMLYTLQQKYKDTVDGGVREGPFWVLVGAQMPSILIEVGYISHPTEGKRLYKSSYQKLLANGIANGIDSYFLKNP